MESTKLQVNYCHIIGQVIVMHNLSYTKTLMNSTYKLPLFVITRLAFTCSKSNMETLEQCAKYV